MKVCATPGCPALTATTYCDRHHRQRRRQSDSRRPSAAARGYGKRWNHTRTAYLFAHPTCQHPSGCIEPATDVHHLDGKGPNGPRGHDWTNLQALCHPHHSQTTAEDQPGGWNT